MPVPVYLIWAATVIIINITIIFTTVVIIVLVFNLNLRLLPTVKVPPSPPFKVPKTPCGPGGCSLSGLRPMLDAGSVGQGLRVEEGQQVVRKVKQGIQLTGLFL